jgi:hypothetical protein
MLPNILLMMHGDALTPGDLAGSSIRQRNDERFPFGPLSISVM